MHHLVYLIPILLAFLINCITAATPPAVSANTHTMAARTPVYFISHGGPNIMFETSHPAHQYLAKIGREITQTIKPKAVVVFSAHWQAGKNHVEVNVDENGPLIYE